MAFLFPHEMKYIPALDGLRAVAIVAVVSYHVFNAYLPGGFIGVDVFFVLSGFLITRLFVMERENTGTIHLPNFLIRRALRLLPALIVMVTLLLILALIIHGGSGIEGNVFEALFALTYTTNFGIGFFKQSATGLFDNTWSLAVEQQFYICWGIGALILLRFCSRRVAAIVLGIAVVCVYAWRWHLLLIGAQPLRIYVGFDTRADELLIGCLGAILKPTQLAPVMMRVRYGGIAALFVLIVIAFSSEAYQSSYFEVIMTSVSLLTFIMILDLVTNTDGPLSHALSFRPLVFVGSISYGIYLWHWPLLRMTNDVGFHHLLDRFIIGACASFLIAACSYQFIERPILGLKRNLAPRSRRSDVETRGLNSLGTQQWTG